MQAISNGGLGIIAAPWTLELQHKGYTSSNKAWNWGSAGGVSVSNGVASGQVTYPSLLSNLSHAVPAKVGKMCLNTSCV
jgi:hypothetical protein